MTTTTRAAIYCRISKDLDQTKEGVGRQEEDCRALAQRMGWEVAAVYVENDVSASGKSRKPRPLYAEMLRRARSGDFGAIVAYSNSRLTRRFREFIDLIDLAEQRSVRIVTVVSGEDNLATADGRQYARIKASIDTGEAERTAERVSRQKASAAQQGRYRGGPRPYGFEKDGKTVRESEAQVIREATEAINSGRSLNAVAKELNSKGLTTSSWRGVPFQTEVGRPWTYARLRDVLIRPRNAGLLSTGRADRGEDRIISEKAEWPAIVSREEYDAVSRILRDPSRRVAQSTEARWIGSNTYMCGIEGCGAPMRSSVTTDKRGKTYSRYYYRCTASSHLSIHADRTDKFVKDVLVEKLSDPRLIQALAATDADATKADREQRRLLMLRIENTEAEYDNDDIDVHVRNRKVGKAQAEIEQIDARLADATQKSATASVFNAPDPAAEFLTSPVDVQRFILRQVLRVTVLPVTARGQKWKPERLDIQPVT